MSGIIPSDEKFHMKTKLLLIVLSLLSIHSCFAQTNTEVLNSEKPRKNVVFGTFGIWPMYSTIMGHYERAIIHHPNTFGNSIGIRLGAGYSTVWTDGGGINYSTNVFTILGREINHLEIGAGLLLAPWTLTKKYNLFPSFNLDYRYHKPSGSLILRTGIGWPEAVHLSIGYCF